MTERAEHRRSKLGVVVALAMLLLLAQVVAVSHSFAHLFGHPAHGQQEGDCDISLAAKAMAGTDAQASPTLPAPPAAALHPLPPATAALHGIQSKNWFSTGPPRDAC